MSNTSKISNALLKSFTEYLDRLKAYELYRVNPTKEKVVGNGLAATMYRKETGSAIDPNELKQSIKEASRKFIQELDPELAKAYGFGGDAGNVADLDALCFQAETVLRARRAEVLLFTPFAKRAAFAAGRRLGHAQASGMRDRLTTGDAEAKLLRAKSTQ